jgi:hypothetical protein
MASLDGLLIVAEAPMGNGASTQFTEEMSLLAAALSEVRAHTSRILPVALAVSKWDRATSLDATTYEDEIRRLNGFLESGTSPGHTIFYQALCNALGADNVRPFPVSAFGASEVLEGHDIPRGGLVRSFGVLDPFPWIANRRAILDMEELGRRVGPHFTLGHLLPWRWRFDSRLATRFLNGTTERQEAERLQHKALWRRAIVGLALDLFALVTVCFLIEAARDEWSYHSVRTAIREGASATEARNATDWLKTYCMSGFPRHLLFKPLYPLAIAQNDLVSLETIREEQLWDALQKAGPDVLAQEKPAQDYLNEFGEGVRACKTIIVTY